MSSEAEPKGFGLLKTGTSTLVVKVRLSVVLAVGGPEVSVTGGEATDPAWFPPRPPGWGTLGVLALPPCVSRPHCWCTGSRLCLWHFAQLILTNFPDLVLTLPPAQFACGCRQDVHTFFFWRTASVISPLVNFGH